MGKVNVISRGVRERIRERDSNTCQICGLGEDDLGRKPDVHHITPRREFDDVTKSNTEDNLIQLCRPCHRKAECGEITRDTLMGL